RILIKSKYDTDYRLNLTQRLGRLSYDGPEGVIWFHAVSLGEVISSEKLVRELLEHSKIFLTVSTPTGLRQAKKIYGAGVEIAYAPWDFNLFIKSYFNKIKPSALVIFETEIWPSMINTAYQNNIPVFLCNGRMSNNSFKRYARFKNITSDTLKKIKRIFVQSKVQATRFIDLGADVNTTEVVGSVKFDSEEIFINSMNNTNNEKIVLFASTHPGEDEILIDAFINLNQEIPNIKLIIVPRHPERASSISSILNKKNISNSLSYNSSLNFNSESAIVIASIGLLSSLYSQASVAFVGGSLLGSSGGHNIIEPAAAGCPFVVGPYMYNFQDILEEFLNADACIQITEYKEIEQSLKTILTDKDQHEKINASALVTQNKGSSKLQANKILQLLKN
ncbi:hypothetical protein N9A06_00670, partial [bacterium]|nr:hypothetical protein [bacterium]